jgi:hypothetical protein
VCNSVSLGIPNGLGARLSNGLTSLIFFNPSPFQSDLSIRHLHHTQVAGPDFSGVAFSDRHSVSIIIAVYFQLPFTALIFPSTGVCIDVDRRLRCGCSRVGVLFFVHHCFKQRIPFQEGDVI